MNVLELFAGGGGGILAGKLLGWTTVGACEISRGCREMLLARQRDGVLERFPIWDDVRTFDGGPWRGCVDMVCGGFPCQDVSAAGTARGLDGERSGLWREMFRVVCEVGPRFLFVENSPMLVGRGLSRILRDLAGAGYDAAWCVLGASDVGARHRRDRLWLLAAHADVPRCEEQWEQESAGAADATVKRDSWWAVEPGMGRVAHGVAGRVVRIRALGNGQVPRVAASAFVMLAKVLGVSKEVSHG